MMYGSIERQRGAGETHGESSMKQTIITCNSNHTSMFVSRYTITFLGERVFNDMLGKVISAKPEGSDHLWFVPYSNMSGA